MNSAKINRETNEQIARARKAEQAGDQLAAREAWTNAAKGLRALAKLQTRVQDKTRLINKALKAEKLAENPQTAPATESPLAKKTALAEHEGFGDEFLTQSSTRWEDIGGMEEAKEALIYSMGLQLAKKPDYLNVDLPSRIMLYGPPGTGKTLLASACASTLDAKFFNVKVSGLLSKYVGESANLISALYQRARDLADEGLAVIFIDEYDSLARSRDKSDSSHNSQVISTLLTELDGLSEKGSSSQVITIVATNRPWDLDDAILSRMDLRIHVSLPDEAARAEIFRILLQNSGVKLEEGLTTAELARRTEGCSGRDIQRLCKKIFLNVLAQENARLSQRVKGNTVKDYTLCFRRIKIADFDQALEEIKIKPLAGAELARYQDWR